MKTLNFDQCMYVLDVMYSCTTLDQFWSWLDWFRVLKIDIDTFKMMAKEAKRFSREKWPIPDEVKFMVRNDQV